MNSNGVRTIQRYALLIGTAVVAIAGLTACSETPEPAFAKRAALQRLASDSSNASNPMVAYHIALDYFVSEEVKAAYDATHKEARTAYAAAYAERDKGISFVSPKIGSQRIYDSIMGPAQRAYDAATRIVKRQLDFDTREAKADYDAALVKAVADRQAALAKASAVSAAAQAEAKADFVDATREEKAVFNATVKEAKAAYEKIRVARFAIYDGLAYGTKEFIAAGKAATQMDLEGTTAFHAAGKKAKAHYEAAIKEPKAAYDKVSGKLAADLDAAVKKVQADYAAAASEADVNYAAALRKWLDALKPPKPP